MTASPPPAVVECGRPFQAPAPTGLTLTGRFPVAAPAGATSVAGSVEVTSAIDVSGVVGPGADMFLVRGGVVVAAPAAQDAVGIRWNLTPGTVKALPGQIVLGACARAGAVPADGTGQGRTVPAGRYELYARVTIVPDGGPAVEAFGGPWPFEVR